MLKPVLTFLFLLFLIQPRCQTKVVKTFHWLQPSLVKEMPIPNLDQNERKCAVIKVVGNPAAYDYDFGEAGKSIATVKKSDVAWIWVPVGATAITISNEKMGVVCMYDFGQILEEKEVYEMELNMIKKKPKRDLHSVTQWVNILDKYDMGADIYLDKELIGKTPYYGSIPVGKHDFRLELNGLKKDSTITVVKDIPQNYGQTFKLADVQYDKNSVFIPVQPQFPGGNEQLIKFLRTNLKYPALAQEQGIHGEVYVSFIVRETGRISDIKIQRALFPACDEEVIQLIKMMPKWRPGLTNNKMAVPVKIQIPIAFRLTK